MTPRFLRAVEFIFEHEGGYNDIKGDAGGATSFGVSLRYLQSIKDDINGDGIVNWLDVKSLTKGDAEEIYYNNFWKTIYEQMPDRIGEKVFDVSVNAGSTRAHIILQKAINLQGFKLSTDGAIGKATMDALAKCDADKLIHDYCAIQLKFYTDIVASKPEQVKFLKGWTNRSNWIAPKNV